MWTVTCKHYCSPCEITNVGNPTASSCGGPGAHIPTGPSGILYILAVRQYMAPALANIDSDPSAIHEAGHSAPKERLLLLHLYDPCSMSRNKHAPRPLKTACVFPATICALGTNNANVIDILVP